MLLLALACTENNLVLENEDPTPGESSGSPEVLVDPTELVFEDLVVGDSATEVVHVENIGDGDLQLIGLELDSDAFAVSALPAPLLAPGDGFDLVVEYQPWSAEDFSGVLYLDTDDADSPTVEVTLSGGTLEPHLVIDPELHDFGTLLLGDSDSVDVRVTNDGEAPTTIEVSYTSDTTELSADLSATPAGLGPGESALITVTYTPTDESPDEGVLTVVPEAGAEAAATQLGSAEDPVVDYTIDILITADDAWEGWLDEVDLSGGLNGGWSTSSTYSETLQSGTHVLAVHATDQAAVIAGLIAAVSVNGTPTYLSGDGSWVMTPAAPSTGWEAIAFDDSAWTTPPSCGDTSPWGSSPSDITSTGALWIWHSSNCRALGEAWFRLDMVLP